MKTKQFGLVGRNISYSFSKKYFSTKFNTLFLTNHSYDVFDIQDIHEIPGVFDTQNLVGFNVTIPYKEQIIPYLDELSEEAQFIGAVNTVLIKGDTKKGFNTDAYGFEKTLALHRKEGQNAALILGDGGAAKAVKYILDKHKIPFITISRKSEITFDTLTADLVATHPIIIQCTPVGTFPNIEDCVPFPFEGVGENHLLIDLIYNPEYTTFIKKGHKQGAKCVNGYFMLEQQAEKAWEIWNM